MPDGHLLRSVDGCLLRGAEACGKHLPVHLQDASRRGAAAARRDGGVGPHRTAQIGGHTSCSCPVEQAVGASA